MSERTLKDYRESGHFRPDDIFIDGGYLAFFEPSVSLVYFAICRHSDPRTSTCQISDSDLSKITGVSRCSVIKARQKLEAYQIISVKTSKSKYRTNIITLLHRDEWLTCQKIIHVNDTTCQKNIHVDDFTCQKNMSKTQSTCKKNRHDLHYIGNTKEVYKERGKTEETSSPPEHINLQIYHRIFGNNGLTIFQQEQIAALKDKARWEKACIWWKTQDYRAGSIGRLIERYHEEDLIQPHHTTRQTQYEKNRELLTQTGEFVEF